MKGFRNNHKYRNGKKQWTKEEYWKYQRYYPQGMYEFVRDNSWGVPSAAMAEMVNKRFGTTFTASGMKQFRQRHGIKSGLTGWYQRGRSPANKGKKLEEYAGRKVKEKVKDWDGMWTEMVHVVYPLPRARKLIDLILEHGTDDDIEKADRCFGRNQKLYRIWREKLHGKKR